MNRAWITLAALSAAAFARVGLAQPLVDRVPADAVAYVGWSGATGKGYEGSNFKGFVEATKLPELIGSMIDTASESGDEETKQALALLRDAGSQVWKYPFAMSLQLEDRPEAKEPHLHVTLMLRAGADGPKLLETLTNSRSRMHAGRENFAVYSTADGVTVLDVDNEGKPALDLGVVLKNPLSASEAFRGAVKHGHANPDAVVFIDAARLISMIDTATAREATQGAPHEAEAAAQWQKYSRLVGVHGLGSYLWTGVYQGKEWATSMLIGAPAPRPGLLAMLDAAPLTDETLKLVPRNATAFYASSFDPTRLMADVRKIVAAGDARGRADFDKGLQEASNEIGFDLEKDLIGSLGSEWLVYSDPTIAGPQGLGLVVQNKLRDPARVERVLTAMRDVINTKATQRLGAGGSGPRFQVQTSVQEGVTIHYLAFPMFSPAVAVHGGRLVVSVSPQGVLAATAYRSMQPGSILDNPKFQDIQKRLGGHKANSLSYADLPQTSAQAYQMMLMATQMIGAIAPGTGGNIAAMLPPYVAIQPFLSPSGSLGWTDEAGYHTASLSPFPGADIFNPQASLSSAAGPMALGILMPALGAARSTARQMQSMTQMRGLHQGCVIWAQGNKENFPPDLGTLHEGNFVAPSYFISPLDTANKLPADFATRPVKEQSAWLSAHSSYAYVTGLKDTNDTNQIVIFEKLHTPGLKMIGVVFNDNHTQQLPIETARQMILKQTGKTLEQWSGGPAPDADKPPPAPR
ncbi:MAG: hypothetical protein K8S99_05115 [Planctomycetes bacterium]|nr:hypothetical protein [Planctomycetota bacterium]